MASFAAAAAEPGAMDTHTRTQTRRAGGVDNEVDHIRTSALDWADEKRQLHSQGLAGGASVSELHQAPSYGPN